MVSNNITKLKILHNQTKIIVSVENEFLNHLKEIAKMEDLTIIELCGVVYRTSANQEDFARAIRAFVCTYYRNLALVFPRDYAETFIKKLKD